MNLVKPFFWSFLSNLAPQLIAPLVFILLARILEPADYGIVAMALVVVGFAQLFKDAGLGQVIVQAKSTHVSNFVFTVQFGIGCCLYIMIFTLSPYIAEFYNTSEVEHVLKILGLIFVVSPFLDIPVYLSIRAINFKAVFIRNSISPIISGCISITMACYGFGYWALVYGQLIGQCLTAIILLFVVRWKPRFEINWHQNRKHIKFGIHMFSQGILSWVLGMADKLFLGKFQNQANVGYYEIASRAANIPDSLLSSSINRLMYPVMAQRQRQSQTISELYLNITKRIAFISLPTCVWLILMAPIIFDLFLGAKWLPSVPLFCLLIITCLTGSIVSLNVEVYKAINRADIMTKFFAARGVVSLPCYYIFSQYGGFALAASRVVLALIFSPVNVFVVTRILKINAISFLKIFVYPVLISIFLLGAYMLCKCLVGNNILFLFLQIPIFMLVMGLSIIKFEPDLLWWRKSHVKIG